MKLQIISTCPSDSLIIYHSGASRIQLVSALQIGGLTPSSTIIRKSLQCVNIPTMVMIRHHNNGFVYQENQIELFKDEIVKCVEELGVKGVVIGGVQQGIQQGINEGIKNDKMIQLDRRILNMLEEQKILSNKIDVTFHKAFDQIHQNNIIKAYQTLSQFNITRVLTQGGQKPITQNFQILKQLISLSKQSPTSPKILLGGGITFQNIKQIIQQTKTQQIHIGTCVRKNKYGPVIKQKVQQFIKLIN